jgi:hypothetical protein
MMRRFSSAVALAWMLAGAANAAEPREVVGHVADQIAAGYFDAAKGARLAAELKAEAAKGAYDRFKDPLDLAQALTARLKPSDAHFNVIWSASPPPQGGPRGPSPQAEEAERRQNYGFRAVELLPGNIALVNMSFFSHFEGADGPAKAAADAAMAMTAGADAVIFDLRDNGGGSPAMVGYLVGHFAPEGANIYNTFKSRGPDEHETPPAPPRIGRRLETPVYVLISGRTGSAAEAFSYTLQQAKRGVIVGEASAGAANPGGMAAVGDGFAVFVSGGSPVNPISGRNWEGTGVVPDVAAPVGQALVKAQQLALARVVERSGSALARTDAQWALEALGPAAPVKALSDYAGAYGARSVAVQDGRLMVAQGRRPPVALKPIGADVFAVEGAAVPIRVKFDRDPAGKVTGMVQTTSSGQATRFAREG